MAILVIARDKAIAVGLPGDGIRPFRSMRGDRLIQFRRPQACFPAPINQGAVVGMAHGWSPSLPARLPACSVHSLFRFFSTSSFAQYIGGIFHAKIKNKSASGLFKKQVLNNK
jgi:hypothetical protein